MFPIILERDTPIIDWSAQATWPTVETNLGANTAEVRSDGILHPDYGTMWISDKTGSVTAELAVCAGVHLAGPMDGLDYTAYQVSVVAMGSDPRIRPYLFMGVSPAVITSDATGDTVSNINVLGFADAPTPDYGSTMEKEVTFITKVKTADRGLCIGVGMLAGLFGSANNRAMVRMSVRRLIGVNPSVLDTRKQ